MITKLGSRIEEDVDCWVTKHQGDRFAHRIERLRITHYEALAQMPPHVEVS